MRVVCKICLTICFFLVICSNQIQGDPLDQVTGTESWRVNQPEYLGVEWKDWYQGRVKQHKFSKELRIERMLNLKIAQLLEQYEGGPDVELVIQVLRDRTFKKGSLSMPNDSRRPSPMGAPKDNQNSALEMKKKERAGLKSHRPLFEVPKASRGKGKGEQGVYKDEKGKDDEDEAGDPDWSKIPVEVLDKNGQAIDKEGDQELNRVKEYKPR